VRNPSNSKLASAPFVPAEVKGKDRILYTVKSGDNVGFIADWFKVRVADLRYWNNLKGNLIREGQQLEIYVEKGKADYYNRFNQMSFQEKQAAIGKNDLPQNQALAQADEPKDGDFIYHTVRQGDNLWDIAKKYPGVSADDIRRLNNISNTRGLTIGQSLKIKKVN
jgi:membrane-bound lytic murein transglycosylase D